MKRLENLRNHFNAISKPLVRQRISGCPPHQNVAKSRRRCQMPQFRTTTGVGDFATGNNRLSPVQIVIAQIFIMSKRICAIIIYARQASTNRISIISRSNWSTALKLESSPGSPDGLECRFGSCQHRVGGIGCCHRPCCGVSQSARYFRPLRLPTQTATSSLYI